MVILKITIKERIIENCVFIYKENFERRFIYVLEEIKN